jgi:hypothetical protein
MAGALSSARKRFVPDESQSWMRALRVEEAALIRALLKHADGGERHYPELELARVSDMDDSGMGSIQFAGEEGRTLGTRLVDAEYVDRDGVLVSIALDTDSNGRLHELDIWKVDFAPLCEYPAYERVMIRACVAWR